MAKRTDSTQAEIIKTLRAAGCSVHDTSREGRGFPDLVVGRKGATFLLEVKRYLPSRRRKVTRLTEVQLVWHLNWQGHVAVVATPEEALAAVGLKVAA